jgi:hypothetical protein
MRRVCVTSKRMKDEQWYQLSSRFIIFCKRRKVSTTIAVAALLLEFCCDLGIVPYSCRMVPESSLNRDRIMYAKNSAFSSPSISYVSSFSVDPTSCGKGLNTLARFAGCYRADRVKTVLVCCCRR